MKRKNNERLQFMTADIKENIRQIQILMRSDDPRKEFYARVKLNELWLAVHDMEYYMTLS